MVHSSVQRITVNAVKGLMVILWPAARRVLDAGWGGLRGLEGLCGSRGAQHCTLQRPAHNCECCKRSDGDAVACLRAGCWTRAGGARGAWKGCAAAVAPSMVRSSVQRITVNVVKGLMVMLWPAARRVLDAGWEGPWGLEGLCGSRGAQHYTLQRPAQNCECFKRSDGDAVAGCAQGAGRGLGGAHGAWKGCAAAVAPSIVHSSVQRITVNAVKGLMVMLWPAARRVLDAGWGGPWGLEGLCGSRGAQYGTLQRPAHNCECCKRSDGDAVAGCAQGAGRGLGGPVGPGRAVRQPWRPALHTPASSA